MQVSGPVKEDTVTGPKIAAVERREARVPDRKCTRRLSRGVNLLPKRRPALRSLAHARGKKKEAPPRASLTIGVDGARLQGCAKRINSSLQKNSDRRGRKPSRRHDDASGA